MPIRATLSKSDILRGMVMEPGWYLFKISKVSQKKAAKDDSMNTLVEHECVDDAHPEYVGIPITRYFSEKAPGFMTDFIEVITGEKIQADVDYDLEAAVGQVVSCAIENGEYNGRKNNQITDYRPKEKHR